MEQKSMTLQEAAEKYAEKHGHQNTDEYEWAKTDFIAGAEYRQAEIDKLKANNSELKDALNGIVNEIDNTSMITWINKAYIKAKKLLST